MFGKNQMRNMEKRKLSCRYHGILLQQMLWFLSWNPITTNAMVFCFYSLFLICSSRLASTIHMIDMFV